MLKWKVVVKAEPINLKAVVNNEAGKTNVLIAPRNIKPNVTAKGTVYVPKDGNMILSFNNKNSGKDKAVSYSMVYRK